MRRFLITWSRGERSGRVVLDEALWAGPVYLRNGGRAAEERVDERHEIALYLQDDKLYAGGLAVLSLDEIAVGSRVALGGASLTVDQIERYPFVPINLRLAPRGDEFVDVPVRDLSAGTVVSLASYLGQRTVLYLTSCTEKDKYVADDLSRLVARHGAVGLKASVLLTAKCHSPVPALRNGVSLLVVGAEGLWALGVGAGQAVVIDGRRRVAWRSEQQDKWSETLVHTTAYLQSSWPVIALRATLRQRRRTELSQLEVRRLYRQASARSQEGLDRQAHYLLDRLLRLSPEHAEARRKRALVKVRLGDVTGALHEVSWWRASFGDESADEFLDQIERVRSSLGRRQ
jgi:hypothetical protein